MGAALKADNKRKHIAVYASFLEYGKYLSDESAWIPIGMIRADIRNAIGASAITRALVRKMVLPGGDSGFVILGGNVFREHVFHYKLHRFVADDAAGKETFCYKGASAWRVCHNCKNVCLDQGDGTLSLHDAMGYLVPLSCHDPSRFDEQSSAEYESAYDDLRALRDVSNVREFDELDGGTASSGARGRLRLCSSPRAPPAKGARGGAAPDAVGTAAPLRLQSLRQEKLYGITIDDDGILADPEVRAIMPLSTFARDPMHTLYASGSVMQVEIFCLFRAVKRRDRDIWQSWASGLQAWATGRGHLTPGTCVFSESREAATLKNKHYVGSASDVLAILPFLRNWVHHELPQHAGMEARGRSFEQMCRLSDLFLKGRRTGTADKTTWVQAVSAALRAHVEAYTDALVKPKHHYLYHACDQASEDNVWLDAFVLERRHKLLKATAELILNLDDFESTSITRAVATALEDANAPLPDKCKWWRTPELDAAVGPQGAANATATDPARNPSNQMPAFSGHCPPETPSCRGRVCCL